MFSNCWKTETHHSYLYIYLRQRSIQAIRCSSGFQAKLSMNNLVEKKTHSYKMYKSICTQHTHTHSFKYTFMYINLTIVTMPNHEFYCYWSWVVSLTEKDQSTKTTKTTHLIWRRTTQIPEWECSPSSSSRLFFSLFFSFSPSSLAILFVCFISFFFQFLFYCEFSACVWLSSDSAGTSLRSNGLKCQRENVRVARYIFYLPF